MEEARSKLHGMKSALPMEILKLIYLASVRQEVHYSIQDRGNDNLAIGSIFHGPW